MIASRLLVLLVVLVALLTDNIYVDHGFMCMLLESLGFMLLLTAALGRIWASAHISGKKSRQLVTDGPYSITRNPLYFFSFLGFVGSGVVFESLTLTAAMITIFFLLHWPTILAEEKNLSAVFEKEFESYAATVPRFFPRKWKIHFLESVEFYPKTFSKALVECGLVACVFIIAHWIEWGHSAGVLPILFKVP